MSNCTNTIREFETYRWKEKSVTQAQDLNEPDVPEKANDHCFTGDTMILTKTGWKRIDKIKKGEYVWSPFGWLRNERQTKNIRRNNQKI
jgi:hypothetical protein